MLLSAHASILVFAGRVGGPGLVSTSHKNTAPHHKSSNTCAAGNSGTSLSVVAAQLQCQAFPSCLRLNWQSELFPRISRWVATICMVWLRIFRVGALAMEALPDMVRVCGGERLHGDMGKVQEDTAYPLLGSAASLCNQALFILVQ